MPNQDIASGSASRSRNWPLIIGCLALVWAFGEAAMAGLANLSGGSLFGVSEQHFALDAIVAALVGIGFVIDGSARRLTRGCHKGATGYICEPAA